MPRSINAPASKARKKRIFKLAKGYWGRGSKIWKVAKNLVDKGLLYAYRDRKVKKRSFRSLWIQRINAGARIYGLPYNTFMSKLSQQNIDLNRKVLADLAMNQPEAFKAIVQKIQ